MNVLSYIGVNLLLYPPWYILLYRKKESLLFADRIIGTFILGLAQIIASEMLLAIVFKKLYPLPLFVLNVFLSLIVLIMSLSTGGRSGIFAEVKCEISRLFRILRGDMVLSCIVILFLGMVWWLVFLGYLFPSYSWDALWYHLPIVGQILQSGAIQEHATSSFEYIHEFFNIFPKNMELFFLWNIVFLKSDTIVDISQLPFAVMGVLTIYSIAVKLEVKDKYAIYASLLFFFAPVIILQSTTNYVDLASSVLFLIALNFLLSDSAKDAAGNEKGMRQGAANKVPILLSGLTAGILLGSKGSGILFVLILICAVLLREVTGYARLSNKNIPFHKGLIDKTSFILYMIYFIVPCLLLGGYWYVNNWVVYGNPVYPQEVSFLNITLFEGLYKSIVIDTSPAMANIKDLPLPMILLNVWMEKVEYYLYDSRLSGFGPLWFILFLPSIVFSLVHAALKRKYAFLFVSTILIVAFLIHPGNWNTRYVIFILGLGALSFGLVLNYFNNRENILRIIAVLLAGYISLTANSPCVMPGKIQAFLLMPSEKRTLSGQGPFNIDTYVRDKYGYWMWVEYNISSGHTLAHSFVSSVLDTTQPFFLAPLWNREFSNRVVFIASDDYRKWLQDLVANNITHVLYKKNSREDEWIEKERRLYYSLSWMGNIKEKFKIVFADENYKIARFMKKEG